MATVVPKGSKVGPNFFRIYTNDNTKLFYKLLFQVEYKDTNL